MTTTSIKGILPAVPTPITSSFEPDIPRLIDLCTELLAQGAHGLNITGTTGEATSMSVNQRRAIIEGLAKSNLPKDQMMFGTGAASVADAVQLTGCLGENGFQRSLVLPPFYFKDPSQDGLVSYFARVVDAAASNDTGVYLYNFPALSGVAFDVPLLTRLKSEFGNRIVGLKDSSGDVEYARTAATTFPGLDVYPSNEGTLFEARNGPFAGCISATANLSANSCAQAFENGDENALKRAISVRKIVAEGPLVPRTKALLASDRNDESWCRVLPPYSELNAADRDTLTAKVGEARAR